LAVFGVIGLQQSKDTEAGGLVAVAGWIPSTVTPGNDATAQLTFYDDNGSTVNLALTGGIIKSVTIPGCAAVVNGVGTANVTIYDAGGTTPAQGTGCDADTVNTFYTATIVVTCTAAGPMPLNITNPAIAGAGTGSVLPSFSNPPVGSQMLTCLAANLAGQNPNTIQIRKIDQFGQVVAAVFSIQQGPFWVEVAKISVGPAPQQPVCDTAGFNTTVTPAVACTSGQVTPNTFPNGLPNGTYRVVEVAGPSFGFCTLVQVYNGNVGLAQGTTQPNVGTMLLQPVTLTLPSANPLDLQLTFVNSCIPPGTPSTATSQIAVVIGGSTPGLVNESNVETVPAPGSDDDARLDIRIRDSNSIPIPNAHVTVLIDKGAIAVRRDLAGFPNSGYDPLEPAPFNPNFGSRFSGDTCDQGTNGWWQQSTANGNFTWPFLNTSRQQADGYTNYEGGLSVCAYFDTTLAPGTAPGRANVQAIVESPSMGGLYNGSLYYNPLYPSNLSLPNYLAAPNIVLTATITVVGPPASITVAAAPTTLNCGEKATITVTVKDSAGQNVSDRTRVEMVTNFGGVLGGTTATLGPVSVAGGNVYPVSSTSAETFNGVATAYLLTSTDHVGPYEVVAAAGGSVMASNGYLAPWYAGGYPGSPNVNIVAGTAGTPVVSAYYPWYNQGLLNYSPSSAPVNAQATVTCTVPGIPAVSVPIVTAPRTGQGPADSFAIRPPNTGDAGLATSSGSSWTLVAGALMVIAISGAAVATVTRR
jgi:hypothetical protein